MRTGISNTNQAYYTYFWNVGSFINQAHCCYISVTRLAFSNVPCSKLNPEIDPTCRLCEQENETLHHLMTNCETTSPLPMDIMQNKTPLPDMSWSVIEINKFLHHPTIHSLMQLVRQPNRGSTVGGSDGG